jgi:hypothetical protein
MLHISLLFSTKCCLINLSFSVHITPIVFLHHALKFKYLPARLKFNTLNSSHMFFPLTFPDQNFVFISHVMHTPSYITHPCNHPCFHHSNNLCCAKRSMRLVTMQFSPASHYFHPLKSKYSTPHPVLKHTESTFCPQHETSFTPTQNKG